MNICGLQHFRHQPMATETHDACGNQRYTVAILQRVPRNLQRPKKLVALPGALQTGTNDPSSVLKLPRRTSGLFFVNGFQTHVQTTKMTTNSIRMQDEDPFSLAAWLHTVLKTYILRGNPWFSSS